MCLKSPFMRHSWLFQRLLFRHLHRLRLYLIYSSTRSLAGECSFFFSCFCLVPWLWSKICSTHKCCQKFSSDLVALVRAWEAVLSPWMRGTRRSSSTNHLFCRGYLWHNVAELCSWPEREWFLPCRNEDYGVWTHCNKYLLQCFFCKFLR